jgi:hypothetical protein
VEEAVRQLAQPVAACTGRNPHTGYRTAAAAAASKTFWYTTVVTT